MTTIRTGDLVYLDSFAGLIPAKLIHWEGDRARVQITASRPGWRYGEVTSFRLSGIVPRNHVYTRSGQCRIRGEWTFA